MADPLQSWSEAASTFVTGKGGSDSEVFSVSPSWSDAAEAFILSSQTESEDIQEACALRVDSDSEGDEFQQHHAPELYWVDPLMAYLRTHIPGGAGGLGLIKVASACSGTLAEASVMKDWVGLWGKHTSWTIYYMYCNVLCIYINILDSKFRYIYIYIFVLNIHMISDICVVFHMFPKLRLQ